jgi:hypothetical protein
MSEPKRSAVLLRSATIGRDRLRYLEPRRVPLGRISLQVRAKQISIKTKYELWVTPPERTEMAEVIADC